MPTNDPLPHDDHNQVLIDRNSRYGLWLFLIYVILYGGFMALAAFQPQLMAKTPFGGVNLAILYGFALIVSALFLALIYMFLCRPRN
jgi:uncharacterized membrane protein (DUF485 family)